MQKKTTLLLAGLVLVVVAGSLALSFNASKSTGANQDVCSGKSGRSFVVDIHGSKVSNADIKAKQCDKIVFMNSDPITREIAFGAHEDHVPYDGVGEKVLNQGQKLTITLDQVGQFHWHDHLHDEIEGYFNVSK